ncbi:hypothetical protein GCM10023091_19190 [Ravibacter arvi]|uniref:DUF4064 domain-containing protein n=1 Tax=Ravibacter arvi TaxID=2051041 RepID=A0ABP8LW68_9BACT
MSFPETGENRPVRPPSLTILCLLSFISAFTGLWRQADQLWSPGRASVQIQETFHTILDRMESQLPDDQSKEAALSVFESVGESLTPETLRKSAIIMLIYESLTLFGAYYMFQLQRRGYKLYMGGIAVGLLGSTLVIGGMTGIVLTFGSLFFSLLFLLLYRLHLKYMY